MNIHKQIIGISWIVIGALILSLLVLKLGSVPSKLVIPGIVVSLIFLAAGFSLMANLRRASWICMPCAALSLFSFPVGTIVGVYYLWYYFKIEQAH